MTIRRAARRLPVGLLAFAAASLWIAPPPALAARTSDPVVKIPLEGLGYQPFPARFLATGASMFTLHFVDDRHLLFTFNSRALLRRLADVLPDDDDRNVTALLLEMPSGRVLARTEWRTRDRNRYLWPIAHGLFLVRIRSRLTIIDPVHNLASGAAFREEPFLTFKQRIGVVEISPGGDLLAVETVPPPAPKLVGGAASAAALAKTQVPRGSSPRPDSNPEGDKPSARDNGPATSTSTASAEAARVDAFVQIHFFRFFPEESRGEPIRYKARSAGTLLSKNLIDVTATAEGFLETLKESSATYVFDFHSHAGKRIELSPFDTSCRPHSSFVSRSEFIAFGCRGGSTRQQLSGFNLLGEENWIQVFSEAYMFPSLVPAPAAGRFAMSRILVASTLIDPENLSPDQLTTQEIRVMQNHDGRLLFKVQAAPIQRSAQNFDLSPDGRSLAVIRLGNVEVYRLPPLTSKDEKEMKRAAAANPERNEAEIRLNSIPAASTPVASGDGKHGSEVGQSTIRPDLSQKSTDPSKTEAEPAPMGSSKAQSLPSAAIKSAVAEPPSNATDPDAPHEPREPPSLYGPGYPDPSPAKPQQH